jgi:hypothetical protein
MKLKFEWERVASRVCACRAKVIGGWIVHLYEDRDGYLFIPDPKHEWEIEE